jgi:MscS family membrane protein
VSTRVSVRPLRVLLLACSLIAAGANAQTLPGSAPSPAPAQAAPEKDPLGRSTPRGTVLGFLAAARKGDNERARHYLDMPASSRAAETLAHQLFVVLDARLPARLTQVSDTPEGSRANPLAPDEEHIGTIDGPSGKVAIMVRRVKPPKAEPLWLFSAETLAAVPDAYTGIVSQREFLLPSFLIERRIGGVRLSEWLVVFLGLPALYVVTVLLNRALTPVMAWLGRRVSARVGGSIRNALPAPARLLIVSLAGRWLSLQLPLSLLVRQLLSNMAAVVGIVALAWLVILVNGEVERHVRRRLPPANYSAAVSLLRVGRRFVDLVVLLAAVLGMLRHFGVDPTPLLAGLGVGGIAVALAAQKTLENVIAGASLIIDQAVRVGDFLKVGDLQGTVDHIGLRSTRIRTLDRSVVSVPNGQIANMSLETLSVRDKFWFHPVVALRYETTPDQMRLVLAGIRQLLARHPAVDGESIRVRFLRLGTFSLDIEVFAYMFARDWVHFLEIQEELLLTVTEILAAAGTSIAFPSQTMYVAGAAAEQPVPRAAVP